MKFIKITTITLLLSLSMAGVIFFFMEKPSVGTPQWTTVAVSRNTLEKMVTAQGKLEPRDFVDVGVQISGQIKKLYVDIGDYVHKGDLLAELDPRVYQSRITASKAKLNALKAQKEEQEATIAFNRLQMERNQKLIKDHAVSQEVLETSVMTFKISEAKIKSLAAQMDQIEAELGSDRVNLEYTKIYAPMDGIISNRIAREGQTLNANQTTPTVLQVANLDKMTVRAQVAEADITSIRPNMEVHFTTLGSTDRQWHVEIRQILPTPEVLNEVVLYNVLMDVDNREYQLMNGMSTQIFFVVDRVENVLTIPIQALGKRLPKQDSTEGKAYAVKIPGSGQVAGTKVIYTGLKTRSGIEVKQGLNEGDLVILSEGSTKKNNIPNLSPKI